MNILITGSQGLVGTSLKKSLNIDDKNNYIYLTKNECDLRNINDTKHIFNTHKPDIVIHLASRVGGVYSNIDNNYQFLIDNILINMNIVECCRIFNVKKLINILSTCIFPSENISYPLTTQQLHNGLPHHSNIGYAYSKRILHILSELLSSNKNIKIINIIPTNLYGENDNYNLQQSHVIPALIHKTFLSKINNHKLQITGDGSAVRQFLYVDDLSKIISHFTFTNYNNNFINIIASPPDSDEISIKHLVNIIYEKIYGCVDKENIVYIQGNNGQHKKTTNDNDIKEYIPNFKFTSLNDGLENVVKYFQNNYDNIRK